MAISFESAHNLDGTARILLNGESNFLAVCDFKGLHVGKKSTFGNFRVISVTTTFEPHRTNHALRDFKNLDSVQRNCFELLIKMITPPPIARFVIRIPAVPM